MQRYFITPLEPFTYIFIGAFILLAVNVQFLTDTFLQSTDEGVSLVVTEAQDSVGALIDRADSLPVTPIIVTFLVWFLIGQILFRFGIQAFRSFRAAKSEIDVSVSYVHPRNFRQSSYWWGELQLGMAHALVFLLGAALRYSSAYLFLGGKPTKSEVISSSLLGLIALGAAFL